MVAHQCTLPVAVAVVLFPRVFHLPTAGAREDPCSSWLRVLVTTFPALEGSLLFCILSLLVLFTARQKLDGLSEAWVDQVLYFSAIWCRAVIKGRGTGIFPLYFKVYPRLL